MNYNLRRVLNGWQWNSVAGLLAVVASIGLVVDRAQAGWQIETANGTSDYAGRDCSLVLDSSGQPHIAHQGGSSSYNKLRYTSWDGTAWVTGPDIDWCSGYTSLQLDSLGRPRIAYYGSSSAKYASWSGTAWNVSAVESIGTGNCGAYASMKLDAAGSPHFVYDYSQNGSTGEMHFADWTGSAWNVSVADKMVGFSSMAGRRCSLGLTASGSPRIAHLDPENGKLMYSWFDGANWQEEIVKSTYSASPYMVLDAAGNPHISFNSDGLKYATKVGSTWSITSVVPQSDYYDYTSIALDSLGRPHIAARNYTDSELSYFSWNGSSWISELVSSGTWVGQYPSLAIDSQGGSWIAYMNGSPNYDLMVAHLDPVPEPGTLVLLAVAVVAGAAAWSRRR